MVRISSVKCWFYSPALTFASKNCTFKCLGFSWRFHVSYPCEENIQILRYTFNGKRLKQRVFLARNFTIAPVVVIGDYIVGVVTESAVRLHFDADEICRQEDHSEPIEQRRAVQYDVDKLLTNALNHLRQGWRRCTHAKTWTHLLHRAAITGWHVHRVGKKVHDSTLTLLRRLRD